MFRSTRISQLILLCGLLPAAVSFGVGPADGTSVPSEHFVPGNDSYRASFELGVPRRFATRYLSDTRTLEIKVVPAKASEFDTGRFYDTRYIHRMLVRESRGEVVLSLQLKNAPVAWFVGHQENPWRIVLDIWRTEPAQKKAIEQEWAWQNDASGSRRAVSQVISQGEAKPKAIPGPVGNGLEIDLPDDSQVKRTSSTTSNIPSSSDVAPVSEAAADFVRLEPIVAQNKALAQLERSVGAAVSGPGEFDALERFATALYSAGQHAQAVPVFRRLAALDSARFSDSPRVLWMAGESALLTNRMALANDYFQTLRGKFAGQESASLADLRLSDLKLSKAQFQMAPDLADRYTELSVNERAPWSARIGASIRLLAPVIETRPEAAAAHQASLQGCIKGDYVSEQLKQECSFLQTKFSTAQMDVVSADAALQRFRKSYPKDKRLPALENQLNQRVKLNLEALAKERNYVGVAELEKSARPTLMAFTVNDPELMLTRVEGWLAIGNEKKAIELLQVFTDKTTDEIKRNEALALSAQLNYKQKRSARAEQALRRILQSSVRKTSGLTDRANAALRDLAIAPYQSKTAQIILIDELKFGRYAERDLAVLTAIAAGARGRGDMDKIYDLILTTSPKNNEEAKQVEAALFQYADDLRGEGRLAKSAEIFMAVANLAQTSRKAESAYKAGIMYARAGLVEKAKTAWQLSAADISDKKFSSLANERLERIR